MVNISDFLNDDFDTETFVKQTKAGRRQREQRNDISFKVKDKQDILGPDKNHIGREMAKIIFALDKKRWPKNEQEAGDYAKDLTEGHEESINSWYDYKVETYLGQNKVGKSPYALKDDVQKYINAQNN